MTLNESAMIINFNAYLEVNEREFTGLEDGEILAKFISVDEYNAMIEDTGFEDYTYSEYLGVFETVKPTLLKDLALFREYTRKKKRPSIPAEARAVYNAYTDLFDYEYDDKIEYMTAEEIVEMFKSREYYDRFNDEFKSEHPYPRFLHECELATPAMIWLANID